MGYLLYPPGIKVKFTHKKQHCTMKKFLTILAVAGVMAACNSGSDETKTGDSTTADSLTTPAPTTPDTNKTATPDTNKAATADTNSVKK